MARRKNIELEGSIWMTVGGANLGGSERIALLAGIGEQGSITRAAKAVGLSYKAAWDAINAMNTLAGEALVETMTGGKGGGGTRLTRRGQRLVANFRLIEQEHRQHLESLERQAEGIADDYLLLRKMALKTSARNQFPGKVNRVSKGAVNDEIELELAGGQHIIAIVTRASTRELGLRTGVEACALIKSSSIILVTEAGAASFSARNQLKGTISRIQPGAVNTEVVMELPGGIAIAAILTNQSSQALGLAVGQQATAIFKASSVIIAIPA